ncbi:cytochrome c biogenesis CcdA family protein [Microbacterium amylolyticum]|uniref:Cytochrome c-type biogenesis protein n=1 Tax=Microbacterium amylolyticum TaxID=936337 RepID=A0ABS4ZJ70_9MICO|nr:cytochrome c biogenesis protein CcdA [Microbacterium amylolyticum]MBP2437336.1 cytochrome c-type biogenesis protein [Microbacterium amylolyticum]
MSVEYLVGAGTLWAALPIALLAGLISFLSPCVLPLVPGYLGFISGSVTPARENADGQLRLAARGRLLGGVLLFIAGFTVVFIAMNVLGGSAGMFFLQYNDIITRVLGGVVILMGIVFLGAFGVMQRAIRPSLNGDLGLVGAPLLGVVLGIGWAPCIGPTLAVIIAMSYGTGDPWRGALLGLVYSLGLGIPFILAALGFGWASRSFAFFRRHVRAINVVGGSLLILLGVLMVSGIWGILMSRLQVVISGVVLPI